MAFPLSSEYIRYLNDDHSYGLTYEQWKERKIKENVKKRLNLKNDFRNYYPY